MISMFPSLLAWDQLSPLLIRLTLGITLAFFGYRKIMSRGQSSGSNSTIYGGLEILVSIFLIIGLFTQLAALINAIILVIKLGFKAANKQLLTDGINYYILLFVMCLSLLVTGAGLFAFDYHI